MAIAAKMAAWAAGWQPVIRRCAVLCNRDLRGRGATLISVFAVLLAVAVNFGAQPWPRSMWKDLGIVSDTPAMRRAYVSEADGLARLFAEQDYRLAALGPVDGGAVPRLAVTALPRDMAGIADSDARKRLFLRALLPLVLKANREVLRTRARVEATLRARAEGRLDAADAAWLRQVADWYGAVPDDAAELLRRIDAVPPSLALAQAAQESGWGTSRFALSANALFGQRSWGRGAVGLAPARAERRDFKVRGFPDLMAAVRSYLHNLNSHSAYADLRGRRAAARAQGRPPQALDLVQGLTSYSEEGAVYVRALRALIRSNDLQSLDDATLRRPQ